jgi:uncharacterized protein YkwD
MSRFLIGLSLGLALAVAVGAAAEDKDKGEKKEEEKLALSPEELKVLDLTNQERAREKLPPLKPNAKLFKAARAHSAKMAEKGMMGHVFLEGKGWPVVLVAGSPGLVMGRTAQILEVSSWGQRARDAGYKYEVCGENVGEGFDSPRSKHTPEDMMKWWMGSPEHRFNILLKDFTEVGLGVVKGKNGKTYYTQLFAEPYKEDP